MTGLKKNDEVYKQFLQSVRKSLWNSGMAQASLFRYTTFRVMRRLPINTR